MDLAFWARDFDQLTFEVTRGRVESGVLYTAVTACRAAERRHRAALAAALDAEGASHVASQWRPDPALEARLFDDVPALCDWSAFGVGPETRMAIAAVRLALGAAVEAALARASVAECWTMAKPGKAVPLGKSKLGGEAWARTPDGKRQLKAARRYNDAALVAAWTSAHAAFVEDCQAGLLEPPSPSIFSVLNSFTEYNFADLLARRVVLKDKSIAKALPLLTLLIKAMNTSARGWETLLEQIVPKSTCLRTIVGRALAVSCSGLHECVHPALRAPWPRRHAAGKRVFLQTSGERLPALVAGATTAAREAVRRLVVTTVACMPATARALALGGHPMRMLNAPPLCAPAPGVEACAECFAAAMAALLDHPGTELGDALTGAFDEPLPSPRQKYDAGWLGKGSAPVATVVPFVKTAGAVFAQAFRAHFLPLWIHAFHHGHPLPRLEAVYHDALHALNAATANIPADRMRLHICWGNYPAPHLRDIPVTKIFDAMLRVRPQALVFEASNARHEHEWEDVQDMDIPDHKVFIPGVIDSTSNFVEHPKLIAQRLCNWANIVGRERVIAGSDCGFGTFARKDLPVADSVVWSKFQAMAEGAAIATDRLWG